eukprot:705986-Pleurochrysis_carterae.AAC.1
MASASPPPTRRVCTYVVAPSPPSAAATPTTSCAPVKTTLPPASLNRLCAPQRFQPSSPRDVKSTAGWGLEAPPKTSSLASLA